MKVCKSLMLKLRISLNIKKVYECMSIYYMSGCAYSHINNKEKTPDFGIYRGFYIYYFIPAAAANAASSKSSL